MPIYRYFCPECGKEFEALLPRFDAPVQCECGNADLKKLPTAFSAAVKNSCPAADCCPSREGGCCGGHCACHHH